MLNKIVSLGSFGELVGLHHNADTSVCRSSENCTFVLPFFSVGCRAEIVANNSFLRMLQ